MAPIPLFFKRPNTHRYGNLGDLLGPIIVAAFTGRAVRWRSAVSPLRRLAGCGTVVQWMRYGTVDLWGVGAEGTNGAPFALQTGFKRRFLTNLVPHSLRGPFTAKLLREAGYGDPSAFGDFCWLLPHLWPAESVPKRWELGVVMHLTEVPSRQPGGSPAPGFSRYAIPESVRNEVHLMDTWVEPDIRAIRAKVEEILACRRILATGLHPLVIAETYGIPCAAFDIHAGDSGRVSVTTGEPLDHRLRDFYSGIGRSDVLVRRGMRHLPTDWEAAMRFIDSEWSRATFDEGPLVSSFPGRYGGMSLTRGLASPAELSDLVSLRR